MNPLIKYLTAYLFLISFQYAKSQNLYRHISHQSHGWGVFNVKVEFHKKAYLLSDISIRRDKWFEKSQQELYRLAGMFQADENTSIGIGYAFIQTYPYGSFPVKHEFPEQRFFQQIIFNGKLLFFQTQQRVRVEQRWLGNSSNGDFAHPRFENRIRHMLKLNKVLWQKENKKISIHAWNEIFISFGRFVGRNYFDQNRCAATFSFAFNKTIQIEAGYLFQILQQRNTNSNQQNIFEFNHTPQLGVNFTFSKKKKE